MKFPLGEGIASRPDHVEDQATAQHFAGDPTVTLWKLRQFGEVLAKRAAAKVELYVGPEDGQQQLIDRLYDKNGQALGGELEMNVRFADTRVPIVLKGRD